MRVLGEGVNRTHVTVNRLESAVFAWTSSLTLNTEKEGLTPLLSSSPESIIQRDPFDLSPGITITEQDAREPHPIAAAYTGPYTSTFQEPEGITGERVTEGTARVVVIADSDFATDSMVQRFNSNGVLFMNLVDYLTQDEGLISIRAKTDLNRPVDPTLDDRTRALYKYGSMILPLVLLVGVGIGRARYRRKRTFHP